MNGYRELPPLRDLADVVECIWFFAPNESGGAGYVDRVFPDGAADIVISEGKAAIYGPASSFRLLPPKAAFTGIRIRRGAAKVVLGINLAEIGAGPVSIGTLWGGCAGELEDRLAGLSAPSDQVVCLAKFLSQRLPIVGDLDDAVQTAIARIDLHPDGTIRDLTRNIGVSERHLRRRFRNHVGLGIKHYARIVRFQRLLDAIRRHKRLSGALSPGWSATAYEHGFADQAHLIEEVRAFAGLTPAELLLMV
jgi:AraC-like DNA-binding protein